MSRDRGKAANETRAESDRDTKLNKLTGRTYESRHSRLDSRQHDRGRGAVSAAPQRLQHVQVLVEVQDLERDAGLPRPLDRPVADLLASGPDGRERRRDGNARGGGATGIPRACPRGNGRARIWARVGSRTLSTLASKVCAAVAQAASSSASSSSSSSCRRGACMAVCRGRSPLGATLALSERPSTEQVAGPLNGAAALPCGLLRHGQALLCTTLRLP